MTEYDDASYACPWCGRIHEDADQSRRHISREKGRMEREARERLDQGHEPMAILIDWIEQRRPIRLPRTRLPGEGSVFRYVMIDGTVRYAFKFRYRGRYHLRRRGFDGEKWLKYSQAEAALHRAMAGDPAWYTPDGSLRKYGDSLQEMTRDEAARKAFREGGIRAARQRRGLSVKALCRSSGVDPAQVRRLERQPRPCMSLYLVLEALDLGGLTFDDLSEALNVATDDEAADSA